MASLPRSPVRMRTQSSIGRTKILPSPTCPVSGVRAAWTIDSTAASTKASLTAISSFSLGKQPHLELGAAINFRVAALPAAAAHVADGHQVDIVLVECFLHGLQALGTDDGDNQFHRLVSLSSGVRSYEL